jgi:hypothetical protein
MANDLAEVAAEWDELDAGERDSWSMDWGNEMAGLARLGRWAADGLLSPEQEARYRALQRQIQNDLPLIERLDLRRPPVR